MLDVLLHRHNDTVNVRVILRVRTETRCGIMAASHISTICQKKTYKYKYKYIYIYIYIYICILKLSGRYVVLNH